MLIRLPVIAVRPQTSWSEQTKKTNRQNDLHFICCKNGMHRHTCTPRYKFTMSHSWLENSFFNSLTYPWVSNCIADSGTHTHAHTLKSLSLLGPDRAVAFWGPRHEEQLLAAVTPPCHYQSRSHPLISPPFSPPLWLHLLLLSARTSTHLHISINFKFFSFFLPVMPWFDHRSCVATPHVQFLL